MTRDEVISHYGGPARGIHRVIARALFLHPSNVSRALAADGPLPADFQARVHVLTGGELRADPERFRVEHEARASRAG